MLKKIIHVTNTNVNNIYINYTNIDNVTVYNNDYANNIVCIKSLPNIEYCENNDEGRIFI